MCESNSPAFGPRCSSLPPLCWTRTSSQQAILQICIVRGGMRKSARQTAHQARACITSRGEIKVSAGALLRLSEWIRQRSKSSQFADQAEQGGVECQITCPPAPKKSSGPAENRLEGYGDNPAGAVVDANPNSSAAGNAAAADADAGSAAGISRQRSRKHSRSKSRTKGGLR